MFTCEDLHKFINDKDIKEFSWNDIKDNTKFQENCPKNGLYIMFEKEERSHNDKRIVRIGINTKGELANRLINHYKHNTVFCRHIGSCLLKIDQQDENTIKEYYEKKRNDLVLNNNGNHHNISWNSGDKLTTVIHNYIRENISFCVMQIDNLEQRKEMEKRLIELVCNCKNCFKSKNWLGKYHFKDTIKNGKLWNIEHVPVNIDIKEILEETIRK